MTRRLLPLFSVATLLVSMLSSPEETHAAEFTDLLDAADDFDESTYDPFDFSLEPSFRFFISNAKIAREAPCVPEEPFSDVPEGDLTDGQRRVRSSTRNPRLIVDDARCSEPSIIYNKEMDFESVRAQLDLTARFGIYKDLELRINVPYVFSSTRKLSFDDEASNVANRVDSSNSSVSPRLSCPDGNSGRCVQREAEATFDSNSSDAQHIEDLDTFNGYRFFNLDGSPSYQRSGFAEPTIGLHWAVFNDQRDPTKATLALGFDYTIPMVPIATTDDFIGESSPRAVGHGMHILDFSIATSKQFNWIEPYFGAAYSLPFASTRSPIREIDSGNGGQVFDRPPMRGEITIGTEFIPHEDVEKGQRYGIDLRFGFGYISEGRDYNPMFDHLANSQCNGRTIDEVLPNFDAQGRVTNPGDVACAWVIQEPANANSAPVYDLGEAVAQGEDARFSSDGIMTVEGHGTFQGLLGVYLQPTHNFQFKLAASLRHKQEHFLTNARTGRDADDTIEQTPDDTVDLEGSDARLERNPVYNPVFSSAGERFRVQRYNTWLFMATAALQF